jgi:glucose-1-phosphate thymidylyltransferase
MKSIVLAAKHERAIDSSGRQVPRPLLDLRAEPLLTTLVRRLSELEGMEQITIVVNDSILPDFQDWARTETLPAQVDLLSDGTRHPEDSKGAMGDLLFALERRNIDDDLLVIGGDNWFTYDLQTFVEQTRQRHPAIVVSPLQSGWRTRRFGLVKVEKDGRITRFEEKPESSDLKLRSSCVYFFARADLPWLHEFAKDHSTRCPPGDFFAWLVQVTDVYAVEMEGSWHDISSTGPVLLELRQIVRTMVSTQFSTWEREVAKSLQWVNSWEDLLEMMDDKDPNLRILAADLAGRIGDFLTPDAQAVIRDKLQDLLQDNRPNDYEYGGFQSDEDSMILVSDAAAESLAKLNKASESERRPPAPRNTQET